MKYITDIDYVPQEVAYDTSLCTLVYGPFQIQDEIDDEPVDRIFALSAMIYGLNHNYNDTTKTALAKFWIEELKKTLNNLIENTDKKLYIPFLFVSETTFKIISDYKMLIYLLESFIDNDWKDFGQIKVDIETWQETKDPELERTQMWHFTKMMGLSGLIARMVELCRFVDYFKEPSEDAAEDAAEKPSEEPPKFSSNDPIITSYLENNQITLQEILYKECRKRRLVVGDLAKGIYFAGIKDYIDHLEEMELNEHLKAKGVDEICLSLEELEGFSEFKNRQDNDIDYYQQLFFEEKAIEVISVQQTQKNRKQRGRPSSIQMNKNLSNSQLYLLEYCSLMKFKEITSDVDTSSEAGITFLKNMTYAFTKSFFINIPEDKKRDTLHNIISNAFKDVKDDSVLEISNILKKSVEDARNVIFRKRDDIDYSKEYQNYLQRIDQMDISTKAIYQLIDNLHK